MKHIKEMLVGSLVGILVMIFLLAVNYYSNIDKDAHYAEIYGHTHELEKEVEEDE